MEAIVIFAVITLANLSGGTIAADAYYDYRDVPQGRVEMLEARVDTRQDAKAAVVADAESADETAPAI